MRAFTFKEVAPCLCAIFIDVLGFGLVAPLLVVLFTNPENNIFQISSSSLQYFYLGLTLAIYPLLMFFGTSFIGDLSDIIGRKKTLLLSMLGMTIGFALMGLGIAVKSLSLFLLGRALSGFVAASQSVALATISDLSTHENKAIHLSYVALIQCIGFVFGPLIGGVLSQYNLSMPFLASALFAALSFVWIWLGFEETLRKRNYKTISFVRFLKVFVEAYHNTKIRDLSIVFLLMQIGVSLYLPVIIILFSIKFDYTSLQLGIFNAYIGIGFALGLLFILPKMIKRFRIEQIVTLFLFLTCITQFLSSILPFQIILWLLAIPLACSINIAYSGMYTSFSNATDSRSQGWVMGIGVAIMAVSWAIAGFATQLIPYAGASGLIFIGSLFVAASAMLMRQYCTKHLRA